jgi:RAB protein geranylgeranyltransferase component A
VLHLDYNDYYGGYASSNTLSGFEKVLNSNPEGMKTICVLRRAIRSEQRVSEEKSIRRR